MSADQVAELRALLSRISERCRNIRPARLVRRYPSTQARRDLDEKVRACHTDACATLRLLKALETTDLRRLWLRVQLRPILLRIRIATFPSDFAALTPRAGDERLQACYEDATGALRLLDGMKECKGVPGTPSEQEFDAVRSKTENPSPARGKKKAGADEQAATLKDGEDFDEEVICRTLEEIDQLCNGPQ